MVRNAPLMTILVLACPLLALVGLLVNVSTGLPTTPAVASFCGCPAQYNLCLKKAVGDKEQCSHGLKRCLVECPGAPTDLGSHDSYVYAPAQAKAMQIPYLRQDLNAMKRSYSTKLEWVYLRDAIAGSGEEDCGCGGVLEQCVGGEVGVMDMKCLNTAHTCLLDCTDIATTFKRDRKNYRKGKIATKHFDYSEREGPKQAKGDHSYINYRANDNDFRRRDMTKGGQRRLIKRELL